LETEYYFQTSDEQILYVFEINDYWFTESGDIVEPDQEEEKIAA